MGGTDDPDLIRELFVALQGKDFTTEADKSEFEGFDLELVGFDCAYEFVEHEDWEPWACPFEPGCGAETRSDCAAAKQRATIHRAPRRTQ